MTTVQCIEMADQRAVELLEHTLIAEANSARQILLEGDTVPKTYELVANVMNFASDTMDLVFEKTRYTPACGKGCSYCCHILVEASVPEILAIAEYIRHQFTPERRERLDRAIDEHIRTTEGMTRDGRMSISVACPLLEAGCCSVYESRPIACRNWHSSDVGRCRAYYEDPASLKTTAVNGLALAAGANIATGLRVALRSRRLDDRAIELVRGLKIALADPSLLETWRERPDAFDAAALDNVHPGSREDRQHVAKLWREAYRMVTNRPEWAEIRPGGEPED
jgi:Fe-S-cluster containining protein